jgi:hypothetical protein
MYKVPLFICYLMAGVVSPIYGQMIKIPMTLENWDTIQAKPVLETYLDRACILLNSGVIIAKNADLRDGTIEADISFPQKRGFPGILFRIQDLNNFENFYVRPHQSGNPDATQYTPVFNGQAGWQLYYGPGFSNAYTYSFDKWHHVKIDLHGLQGEIYIDDMHTPLIRIAELKRGWQGGRFGFTSGGLPFRIANVQYSIKTGEAPTPIPVPENGANGWVTEWHVSNILNKRLFENRLQLKEDIKRILKWTDHPTESTGIINLSKYETLTPENNTIVCKLVIESKIDQMKAISFGYSDYVTVYLNDKALYYGYNTFMSRDYRFLGTIGYFDKLFLSLKKGRNELWFVLSEDFGGWGIEAKFQDMDGITLK